MTETTVVDTTPKPTGWDAFKEWWNKFWAALWWLFVKAWLLWPITMMGVQYADSTLRLRVHEYASLSDDQDAHLWKLLGIAAALGFCWVAALAGRLIVSGTSFWYMIIASLGNILLAYGMLVMLGWKIAKGTLSWWYIMPVSFGAIAGIVATFVSIAILARTLRDTLERLDATGRKD